MCTPFYLSVNKCMFKFLVQSADFKAGVASLAQLLQIPPHMDHAVVIKVKNIQTSSSIANNCYYQNYKYVYAVGLFRQNLNETGNGTHIILKRRGRGTSMGTNYKVPFL